MIAAVKFNYHIPLSEAAGQPDCRHGGFCPGAGHAHQFHGRYGLANQLRQLRFRFRRRAEAGSSPGGAANCFDDVRGSMPQNHRPPGKHKINIFPAGGIINFTALCMADKKRIATDRFPGTDGRVDPAGNDFSGGVEIIFLFFSHLQNTPVMFFCIPEDFPELKNRGCLWLPPFDLRLR